VTVPVSGRLYQAGEVAVIPNHKAVGLISRGHVEVVGGVESAAKKPVKEKATKSKATAKG